MAKSDLHGRTKSELISLLEETEKILALDGDQQARVLHDLQVHRLELELQNRELKEQQSELEELHDRLVDVYELSPVGFLVLDQQGVIQGANLTAGTLLSSVRSRMVGFPLAMFLDESSKRKLRAHLDTVYREPTKSSSTVVTTAPREGAPHTIELTSTIAPPNPILMVDQPPVGEELFYSSVLVDISAWVDAENHLAREREKRRHMQSLYQDSKYLSLHDPLTQLPNRLMLMEIGQQVLQRAERNNYRVAVLFLDLDYFKPINDLYGHSLGDKVLREVAERLKDSVRSSDLVCRWGGDEFVVILEDSGGVEKICKVVKHIQRALSASYQINGDQVTLGATVGGSMFPGDGQLIEELIRLADITMYYVKRTSRGEFDFFNSAISESQAVSLETEEAVAMRRMLDQLGESRVDLFFQSVAALGSIIGQSDQYVSEHSQGVADLAVEIAKQMDLTSHQITGVKVSGMLHDIGKVSVPLDIWNKTEPLNESDWIQIKKHPQSGYDTLNEINFPWPVAETVLQHQERMDGSGYPQGLKGDEILLEARIIAVADVIDAMTSSRIYRPALGMDEALAEINRGKGVLYDTEVVDAANSVLEGAPHLG